MPRLSKLNQLRDMEPIVYRMAYALHENDRLAIATTKRVLCRLWKEPEFFSFDERKQQRTIIWLVSCEATEMNVTA